MYIYYPLKKFNYGISFQSLQIHLLNFIKTKVIIAVYLELEAKFMYINYLKIKV